MPNWCQNKTKIVFNSEAKQGEIKQFVNDLFLEGDFGWKYINFGKFVPLIKNDLYGKVTSIYQKPYDKQLKQLTLTYDSMNNPINKVWETIYENHSDLIDHISTEYQNSIAGYYGEFKTSEFGVDDISWNLPNVSYLDEDNFKELYKFIKQGNVICYVPDKLIEDIENSENYEDFFNQHFEDEFNAPDDCDFNEVWDKYIQNNNLYYEIREEMKKEKQDYDEYLFHNLAKHQNKLKI